MAEYVQHQAHGPKKTRSTSYDDDKEDYTVAGAGRLVEKTRETSKAIKEAIKQSDKMRAASLSATRLPGGALVFDPEEEHSGSYQEENAATAALSDQAAAYHNNNNSAGEPQDGGENDDDDDDGQISALARRLKGVKLRDAKH